jgi:hypothetical protein
MFYLTEKNKLTAQGEKVNIREIFISEGSRKNNWLK